MRVVMEICQLMTNHLHIKRLMSLTGINDQGQVASILVAGAYKAWLLA